MGIIIHLVYLYR